MANSDLIKALLKLLSGGALITGSIFAGAAGKRTVDHARSDFSSYNRNRQKPQK